MGDELKGNIVRYAISLNDANPHDSAAVADAVPASLITT